MGRHQFGSLSLDLPHGEGLHIQAYGESKGIRYHLGHAAEFFMLLHHRVDLDSPLP
jgi:hypothetical protein